jgi:hypothetical protein
MSVVAIEGSRGKPPSLARNAARATQFASLKEKTPAGARGFMMDQPKASGGGVESWSDLPIRHEPVIVPQIKAPSQGGATRVWRADKGVGRLNAELDLRNTQRRNFVPRFSNRGTMVPSSGWAVRLAKPGQDRVSMKGEYVKILRSIGTRIRDRLMSIGNEPLPQGLVDLLRRLTERERLKSDKRSERRSPDSNM